MKIFVIVGIIATSYTCFADEEKLSKLKEEYSKLFTDEVVKCIGENIDQVLIRTIIESCCEIGKGPMPRFICMLEKSQEIVDKCSTEKIYLKEMFRKMKIAVKDIDMGQCDTDPVPKEMECACYAKEIASVFKDKMNDGDCTEFTERIMEVLKKACKKTGDDLARNICQVVGLKELN